MARWLANALELENLPLKVSTLGIAETASAAPLALIEARARLIYWQAPSLASDLNFSPTQGALFGCHNARLSSTRSLGGSQA